MSTTQERIVDAAIATFIRFGARKTAMNDIASAAGVSRQTLYDVFGNKDELIQAAITRNTDLVLNLIESSIQPTSLLEEQLDLYLDATVVKAFERLRTSEDVEDLISGHNEAGREAIRKSHARHRKVVETLLNPYEHEIEHTGQSVSQLSAFFVRTAMSLKHCQNRRELRLMLGSLKTAVLLATNSRASDVSERSALAG